MSSLLLITAFILKLDMGLLHLGCGAHVAVLSKGRKEAATLNAVFCLAEHLASSAAAVGIISFVGSAPSMHRWRFTLSFIFIWVEAVDPVFQIL